MPAPLPETEVPIIPLAKVGPRRERRRAGIPFWFLGKGSTSWTGVAAGSGAGVIGGLRGRLLFALAHVLGPGGPLATLGAKILVTVLAVGLGAGAYGLGRSLAPQEEAPLSKPKPFAAGTARYEGDISGLPSNAKDKDSVVMVSGGDELKPQAPAAAAPAAEAKAEEQPAEPQNAAPDTTAIAQAAAEKNKGPFAGRFGALTQALSGSKLAGGSGLSGGVSQPFGAKLGELGNSERFASGRIISRAPARPTFAGSSRGRGLARRQLDRAVTQSGQASRATQPDTRAAAAGAPFTNNPGGGSSISGPGAGDTGNIDPSAGGNGTPNPGGGGSLTPGYTAPADTGCAKFSDSGELQAPEGGCAPAVSEKKDVTPWGQMVRIAGILLLIASALVLAAVAGWLFGWFSEAVINALAAMATMLAGIATILGIVAMGQGQTWQGALITLVGAAVTAGAAMVWINPAAGAIMTESFYLTTTQFAGLFAGVLGAGTGLFAAGGALD